MIIDLEEWGEFREDIYEVMVARSRKDEATLEWEVLKPEMAEVERPL